MGQPDQAAVRRADILVHRVRKNKLIVPQSLQDLFFTPGDDITGTCQSLTVFRRTDDPGLNAVLFSDGRAQGAHGNGFTDQGHSVSGCLLNIFGYGPSRSC